MYDPWTCGSCPERIKQSDCTCPHETCKFEFIKDWIDGAIRHHVNEFHTGEGNCK